MNKRIIATRAKNNLPVVKAKKMIMQEIINNSDSIVKNAWETV